MFELDPTPKQRVWFLERIGRKPNVLVRHVRAEPEALEAWASASLVHTLQTGARRVYAGTTDGTERFGVRYDAIVVDTFLDADQALAAIDLDEQSRRDLLEAHDVLAVRPASDEQMVALRLLSKIIRRIAPKTPSTALHAPKSTEEHESKIWLSSDELERAMGAPMAAPLVVYNLNEERDQASYDRGFPGNARVTGEQAYGRYARNVVPMVLRRGGRPMVVGRPLGVLTGAEDHLLQDRWTSFALVYYPQRAALVDMISQPDYEEYAEHRVAALERADLRLTTPMDGFDPGV